MINQNLMKYKREQQRVDSVHRVSISDTENMIPNNIFNTAPPADTDISDILQPETPSLDPTITNVKIPTLK